MTLLLKLLGRFSLIGAGRAICYNSSPLIEAAPGEGALLSLTRAFCENSLLLTPARIYLILFRF
jgi:hypothetical protein